MHMYDTTLMLKDGGFQIKRLLSCCDTTGNTPLHMLSRYVGCPDPRPGTANEAEYHEQVILVHKRLLLFLIQ